MEALTQPIVYPPNEQDVGPENHKEVPPALYYDYSEEHFEPLEFIDDEADTVPAGYRHHIKTIEEERSALMVDTSSGSPFTLHTPGLEKFVTVGMTYCCLSCRYYRL